MILPIYVYGQPVLRKVAEDITPDYPNLKELIANMFETMVHADGVGLAAPQIGLPFVWLRLHWTLFQKIIRNLKVLIKLILILIFWK